MFNQSTPIQQETTPTYYCALVRPTTTRGVDVNQALTALLDPPHQWAVYLDITVRTMNLKVQMVSFVGFEIQYLC